jgi:hypothetical protein
LKIDPRNSEFTEKVLKIDPRNSEFTEKVLKIDLENSEFSRKILKSIWRTPSSPASFIAQPAELGVEEVRVTPTTPASRTRAGERRHGKSSRR